MPSVGFTPTFNTTGVFQLKAPFTIAPVSYTVVGIENMKSLVKEGRDIFNDIYVFNSLTETEYLDDLDNNVNIVTLEHDEEESPLEIPSSYIIGIPEEHPIPYQRYILTIDVDEMPHDYNIYPLIDELKTLADSYLGKSSSIQLHRIPLKKIITILEHNANLVTLQTSAENFSNTRTALSAANAVITDLQNQVDALKTIIIDLDGQLNP